MKIVYIFLAALCLPLFFSCEEVTDPVEDTTPPNNIPYVPPESQNIISPIVEYAATAYETPSRRVKFNEGETTVTLPGLNGHSVYLVKVNKGSTEIPSYQTGNVKSDTSSSLRRNSYGGADATRVVSPLDKAGPVSAVFTSETGETVTRYEFQGNEKVYDAIRAGLLQTRSVSRNSGATLKAAISSPQYYAAATIGASKEFWTLKDGKDSKITATLRAVGTYSNVWVADENFSGSSAADNKITAAQAGSLASKFDTIYGYETPVFGYEYGGGITDTGDENYGGVDSDPKIQILVFDIDGDYRSTQTGGTLGYFYTLDEFFDATAFAETNHHSNQTEMFYIDAFFTAKSPAWIYSTLAHEFQHMINFNQKVIRPILAGRDVLSEPDTWYNEMLSMLAEDLIDPLIGIGVDNNGHPVLTRIPGFLSKYYKGDLTEWGITYEAMLASYDKVYGFGAYMVRNFGGAKLVQEIMSNNFIDIESLNAALNSAANPNKESVNSFAAALSRFGEAMMFNQADANKPTGVFSFNNTVTSTINGTNYTFNGFDVWTHKNSPSNLKGPVVWKLDKAYALDPYTILLQSKNEWQGVTGDLTITFEPPADINSVDFYVMVR
ncbi:MAG: hypothetical protein LBB22_00455 [Treponema sp.]|jgi:hypothetical protein|nr:hypothetical protein [Treponema sp.]